VNTIRVYRTHVRYARFHYFYEQTEPALEITPPTNDGPRTERHVGITTTQKTSGGVRALREAGPTK
jgi:hypothetical protein